ncbi:MAG: hypothetical protein LRZ88_05545 [Candidatus Cloacimonetes bacterium]|nr:hypothetical protein [Candidatus Cloacimonadota bacterium]
MKIIAGLGAVTADDVRYTLSLSLSEDGPTLDVPDSIAYAPLINAHDHLIGNWVPRAGDHRPYPQFPHLGRGHEGFL